MEVITDRPERHVALLVALDQLAVTISRFAAGQIGTEPHVHREHADAFLVLDGCLTLPVGPGGDELVVGRGELVVVPPGVVHSFRNAGPAEARFLNIHAPSGGFHEYMRGRTTDWDSGPPPADGGRPPDDVCLVAGLLR